MNNLIKPAKTALAKKYGFKNISVRNGQGTAWGWVEVRIEIQTPRPCDFNCKQWEHSYKCREELRSVSLEAQQIMNKEWISEGLKPYTYSPDDGYSRDSQCSYVEVHYAR